MTVPAVFEPRGATFVPTSSATGPWSKDNLHGGPVIGLLARAIEQASGDPSLVCARLTVDLLRPAPHKALRVETQCVRQGSRLQLLQAGLFADSAEIARASALMLRESDQAATEHTAAPQGPAGLPTEGLWRGPRDPSTPPGFHTCVETRWVPSSAGQPLAIWFRMPMQLVAQEEPSAFQSAAALCDFANAVASIAAVRRRPELAAYINADCTLCFSRRPRGEWFCLQERASEWERGVSIASVTVSDEDGCFGRVLQSRLVAARA
jgi:acyl-coenzyme A thioesterase PaaI-like protein